MSTDSKKLDTQCCDISDIIEYYREPNDRIGNIKLGILCNLEERTSLILKHITECCYYDDFLEELAQALDKDKVGLISYLGENHKMFVLHLGIVLRKDLRNTDVYDRLFNCIPLIKRALSTDRISQSCAKSFEIFRDVVDLNILKDFIFCTQRVKHFRKLSTHVLNYDFIISHPEGIIPEDSPFTFCANIRKANGDLLRDVSLDICVEEGYFATVSMDTICEYLITDLQGDHTQYYILTLKHYFIRDQQDYDHLPSISTSKMFTVTDHLGCVSKLFSIYIPADEIGNLFDLAYRQASPIYIDRRKIRLTGHKMAKSAKK